MIFVGRGAGENVRSVWTVLYVCFGDGLRKGARKTSKAAGSGCWSGRASATGGPSTWAVSHIHKYVSISSIFIVSIVRLLASNVYVRLARVVLSSHAY